MKYLFLQIPKFDIPSFFSFVLYIVSYNLTIYNNDDNNNNDNNSNDNNREILLIFFFKIRSIFMHIINPLSKQIELLHNVVKIDNKFMEFIFKSPTFLFSKVFKILYKIKLFNHV